MGAGEERRVRTVVLDTNVLVSAYGWNGPERRVYERRRAGELRQSISPDLLLELERVLHYPKLEFTESEIRACLRDLAAHAKLVVPGTSHRCHRAGSWRQPGSGMRGGERSEVDRLGRLSPSRFTRLQGNTNTECCRGAAPAADVKCPVPDCGREHRPGPDRSTVAAARSHPVG